ncbi:MAG: prolyl oligopeptidase family serine peptidase [Pirellulaceae bacterium]
MQTRTLLRSGYFHRQAMVVVTPCIAMLLSLANGYGQGSLSDYQRWASYAERTSNRVFRQNIQPQWFDQASDKMWYRVDTGRDSHEFVLVDTANRTRKPAFDHKNLAAALSDQIEHKVSPDKLDLRSVAFTEDVSKCKFRFSGQIWEYDLPAGPLKRIDSISAGNSDSDELQPQKAIAKSTDNDLRAPIQFQNRTDRRLRVFWVDSRGQYVPYGNVDAGKTKLQTSFVGHAWLLTADDDSPVAAFVVDAWNQTAVIDNATPKPTPLLTRRRRQPADNRSPDKTWRVSTDLHNVVLLNIDTKKVRRVTADGDSENSYGGPVWWSPDSKHFVVMKTRNIVERKISMIDSKPGNSIHGKLKSVTYVKPGDLLDRQRPVLFHVDQDTPTEVDNQLFDNPFDLRDLEWHADSKSFSFVYNKRGHQVLRLISVDVETAIPRVMIDETSDTFVCYSQKQYLRRLDNTNEVIWMSERAGWNHLYLIDRITGEVKNPITQGDWVVREVERVDEENRQLWLSVSGIDSDQDPYHVHLIRVGFDGQGLTRLTRGDGDHKWKFSPDNRFLIDTYSRVDLPPVTELRDSETGDLICELERADATELINTGWQYPERFIAKGRDGKTDIHGVIIRPTNLDPDKQYPVLESIYAGPHSAYVPKSFGLHNSMFEMAELGFIVVKIDGMGTSHRSKAFHDVCWKNLGDSGFPDRIAWIKAAATKHPEMDLSRVGIWGGSAGGQSAMRALIAHGDFYHAAVADCGCHDNRVDKIWWNEQWMGWPIGPHYAEQSNVTQAHRMQGDLMLIWGELDTNVDPVSTVQVIDALIAADKDFQQLIVPGVGHGAAGHPYAKRRQADFFVRKLWHREPRQEN